MFRRQAKPVASQPTGSDFETVLEGQTIDPAPLITALDYAREHLDRADNIAESHDDRDFYEILDRLSAGVAGTFPQSLCKAGCSSCCYYPVALFNVSLTEWNIIRRYVEREWSESERQTFQQRFAERFNKFWLFLLSMLQASFFLIVLSAPLVQHRRLSCPFLREGKCSIYPVRPYQCRTFGYFSARSWPFKQPRIYACNEQGENLYALLSQQNLQFQLPVMNPIVKRLRRLCEGPRQSLPLWVAAWLETKNETKEIHEPTSSDSP